MIEPPVEPPVAPPSGGDPPAPAAPSPGDETPPDMHPLFADSKTNTLSADFASKLGPDLAPYADVLNQRFGGQPIEQLARSYGEANKMISEGGRPIGYPAPDSTPEAWAKWSSANGVPESPDGYKLFPDGAPNGLDPEIVGQFQQAFHEEKAPPALAQRMAARYAQIEAAAVAKAQDAYKQQQFDRQQELQKSLGIEYEDRIAKVKGVVASQGFDPGDPELFDNPKVVGFLLKMTNLLGEDTVASMKESAIASGAFRGDGKSEAMRIMTDKTHPEYERYQQGDTAVAAKVTRLLKGG